MSSVWYYEPFYDLDRFFDDTFGGRLDQRRRIESGETTGGAVRAIKPRYVIVSLPSLLDS
jgi:HSP20 family protein